MLTCFHVTALTAASRGPSYFEVFTHIACFLCHMLHALQPTVKKMQRCRNWAVIKIVGKYLSPSLCDAEIYFIIICQGRAGPCTHHWLFLLSQIVKVRVPAAVYGCLTLETDSEATFQTICLPPVRRSPTGASCSLEETGIRYSINSLILKMLT